MKNSKVIIPPVKVKTTNPSETHSQLKMFIIIVNVLYSDTYVNMKVFLQGN
ncbi:MAG: hypothetical protein BWY70_01028 [Bacteroidetes bacterium ADurb.Bin408]|nr:MAG: hypothetical protein BWY70_01028 [Bacteroidetes bacterium ADurb.Bin408]